MLGAKSKTSFKCKINIKKITIFMTYLERLSTNFNFNGKQLMANLKHICYFYMYV